jgi:Site-specific recombinase XerD
VERLGSQSLDMYRPGAGREVGSFIDSRTKDRLRRIIDDGTPPNTKRAYTSDMNYFWSWCSAIGWTDEPILPVPAEIVARFVVDHLEGLDEEVERDLIERGVKAGWGTHSMNTIDRRVSALSALHKTKGLPSPVTDPLVSQILSKARKANARRGKRVNKKKAVVKKILDQLLEQCASDSLIDKRDRALLLFGWASGGRRRSEIADATMDRLEESDGSYVYHMGITKTDQEGDGMAVPVTGRAAAAMTEWLTASGITKGHVFRAVDRHGNVSKTRLSDKAVALIVKRHAQKAGLNATLFAGHSLRSGFLTETGLQGKNLLEAMKLSGHKTMQVAAGYHQSGAALLNETAGLAG